MRPATPEEKAQYTRNPHSGHAWTDDELIPEQTNTEPTDTTDNDATTEP